MARLGREWVSDPLPLGCDPLLLQEASDLPHHLPDDTSRDSKSHMRAPEFDRLIALAKPEA